MRWRWRVGFGLVLAMRTSLCGRVLRLGVVRRRFPGGSRGLLGLVLGEERVQQQCNPLRESGKGECKECRCLLL